MSSYCSQVFGLAFVVNFWRENLDKLLDLTNQLVDYLDPSLAQLNEFSFHLTL